MTIQTFAATIATIATIAAALTGFAVEVITAAR